MANFPGNPYALAKGTSISPEQAIYQAIMTLAYEVRTANIVEAAKPVVLTGPGDPSEIMGKLREAGERLGYSGAVKVNGRVAPAAEDEPKRIVITLPEDPDLVEDSRTELVSTLLETVERAQGIYPVEVR